MSTTNIARLATTGSNTFVGNQTITGAITASTSISAQTANFTGTTNGAEVLKLGSPGTINAVVNTADELFFNIDSDNNQTGAAFHFGTNRSTTTGGTELLTIMDSGTVQPGANGTQDLGSSALRWGTIYTSDLSLNNGIGDWTIVEGEDDLFLYNNKKGKVYKFALTEVDPNIATPKKS